MQILGQPITTRDEAVEIANKVLDLESDQGQGVIGGLTLELMSVEHDPNQNIWIFGYWENNIEVDGSSFHVVVSGDTSELLRMWVE